MSNANLIKLRSGLDEIQSKGESYNLTITSMGNLIYILNTGVDFYALLVPNKTLDQNTANKILTSIQWEEKFHLTNYHKSYDYNKSETLLKEVEKLLIAILKVPNSRQWRFDIQPEMMIVKSDEESIPTSVRRELNKRKFNSPIRKFLRKLDRIFFW
ncbi:MAG: hypothetical protein AAF611_17215 [Bacteroidota bacterium]